MDIPRTMIDAFYQSEMTASNYYLQSVSTYHRGPCTHVLQEEDWGSQARCGALFGDGSLRHCMPRGWQDRPALPQAASHIEDSIVGPLPKILELPTSFEKRVVA